MIGRIIGNYEVVSQFGEGGMGELFLGRHTRLAREVIIKTIRTEDFSPKQIDHLRDRLEREAFVQSQLDHVNIVRVYDFVALGDTTCMIMEYVPGRDLRKMILRETGPIPASRAIHLFKQVLAAINYAHSFVYSDPAGQKHRGIIHRDLKPANILVTPDDVVKVTDFGIVKLKGVKGGTQLGFNPGTPEYMSPEQALGRDVDQRSDIYSLGVVFYEMLTGRVPFEDSGSGTSDYAIRKGHIEMPVPPPSQFYPAISPELEKILLRALEKNPDLRFQEASDFLNAIEEYERTGLATGALRTPQPRQTVIQRRASSDPNGTVIDTRPSEAGRDKSLASSAQLNETAPSKVSLLDRQVIEGPEKKKLSVPVIAGIAAAALAVVVVVLWSVIPGSTTTGTPTPNVTSSVPPGMIPIPGSTFMMGRNDGNEFEGPAHEEKVAPFLIDEAEVTNDQYQQFVDATQRRAPSHWSQRRYPNGEASQPVVQVTWFDAKEYCESLNKRLPTEEEWEFAARSTTGWLYPYGNEWKPNYSAAQSPDEPRISSRPVRSYPDGRSPFGLYDMAGNVLEWTSSDFKVYPGGKVKQDEITANTGRKVTRGGAFVTSAKYQTVTDRFFYVPTSQNHFIGFRCAKDVPQPQQTPQP